MKSKLLAALKSKFPGVKEATLDRIATSKAGTVTDEDQIQSIVDGVTVDSIIDSESDYRGSQEKKSASVKAIADYEAKYKLKDGKSTEKEPEPKPKEGGEEEPEWAKKLNARLDKQDQELENQKKEREASGRLEEAAELMKASKIPERKHKSWLKRIDLNDEETSIEDQVKALEDEYLEDEQTFINEHTDGNGGHQGGETTDADMDEFLEDKFADAEE